MESIVDGDMLLWRVGGEAVLLTRAGGGVLRHRWDEITIAGDLRTGGATVTYGRAGTDSRGKPRTTMLKTKGNDGGATVRVLRPNFVGIGLTARAARHAKGVDRRTEAPSGLDPDLGLAVAGHTSFAGLVRRQLELLGEDPEREGLLKTPERVAKSLAWLTRGYGADVHEVIGDALFEAPHKSMVMVRDIELYSMCEHHLLPFFGKAHIAYIPDGRIVGLSKLPRIVDVFARRLQVQERLTEDIAQAIEEVLAPKGVGVVVEAVHLCMMMRGVEKQNSKTITSALLGSFRDDAKTRGEFLRLAYQQG